MKQRLLVSGQSAVEERKKRTVRMSLQQNKVFAAAWILHQMHQNSKQFVAHIFVVVLTDVNAPFCRQKNMLQVTRRVSVGSLWGESGFCKWWLRTGNRNTIFCN